MPISKMRGLARRFIPEMIKLGMTTGGGLGLLRLEGMGYRRTDFLADWREFSGLARKRDPLRAIPKKYRPTEATIERTDYEQVKKFHYSYKVEGYDLVTQESVEDFVTVATDDIMTMQEAEEEAERLADKYKLDIEIAKVIIDGITVRK